VESYETVTIYHQSMGPRFRQRYDALLKRCTITGKDEREKTREEKKVPPLSPTEACLYAMLDAAHRCVQNGSRTVDFQALHDKLVDPQGQLEDDVVLWQNAFDEARKEALVLFRPTPP
jgi:hypothetical protein